MDRVDRVRIERLAWALESALRRLEKVDPQWDVYGPRYPERTTKELITLHEAAAELRTARRFLDGLPDEG